MILEIYDNKNIEAEFVKPNGTNWTFDNSCTFTVPISIIKLDLIDGLLINKKELKNLYIKAQFFKTSYERIIEWAMKQIEIGIDDMNINILAGLEPNHYFEVREYIEQILDEELNISKEDLEEWAGNYITEQKELFENEEIDIWKFDEKISKIYYKLDYPCWMHMLARNCEYSTDIDVFEKPFKNELDYITGLWAKYPEYTDFIKHYDRTISNQHDYK